jgi:hypothetical protein
MLDGERSQLDCVSRRKRAIQNMSILNAIDAIRLDVAILHIESRKGYITRLTTAQRIRFDRWLAWLAIEPHVAQVHQ